MSELAPIRRALVSVSDKKGLEVLAEAFHRHGVGVIASGGTAARLAELGAEVTPVESVTGHPEILGGRVKTLHPRVHGGILADTDDPGHVREMEENSIGPIDLVVCNLYPFRRTVAAGASDSEIIENIDIGGPAMIRAAAKNHTRVAVVTRPDQYAELVAALDAGGTTLERRRRWAAAAFAHTGSYDAAVHGWFTRDELLPAARLAAFQRRAELRYGENPHQQAALYRDGDGGIGAAVQLGGKELSYNNYADADSAWDLVNRLPDPGCVVIKHLNPCGAAVADTAHAAFVAARDCDPVSAFGGVVALNTELNEEAAKEMTQMFLEVVVAPAVSAGAATVLNQRKNLRVLVAEVTTPPATEAKAIAGGLLVQEADPRTVHPEEWTVTSARRPTEEQLRQMRVAWVVGAHCKSNSIVIVQDGAAVGIGVGDQSRVGAARRAVAQAGDRSRGAVAASEALLPFRDGLDVLADAGVEAIVQTGGSRNDAEVIAAADERNVALVFTGRRHFRH